MLPRNLELAGLPVEPAETEVAMGDEVAHAQLPGAGQCSVEVLRGRAERRRNALVQRFGRYAFMALTGGATIQVFPQAATVFRALRPFPRETAGKRELRPPAIPADFARELKRVVRLRDRLGSIREVAHRMDLERWQVRQRLATARMLEAYGHPVHKKRC